MRLTCAVSLALACLLVAESAAAVTLPVLEDVTVYSGAPDDNYNGNTHQGGLFIGGNSPGQENRVYLKFQLPVFVPGTVVSSAILSGYYQDELFETTDGIFAFYLAASDAWSETTATWNDQVGSVAGELDTWDADGAPFGQYSFDLTAAANAEYQGDGVLSLVFREIDESTTGTWEYWRSKEALPDGDLAKIPFQLEVTVALVPEPASGALLALGLATLAARRRRVRRPGARGFDGPQREQGSGQRDRS